MTSARASGEAKAQFFSRVPLGMGSTVQARPAGQRRGSAAWTPSPCSRKLGFSREQAWPPVALTGSETCVTSRELGMCQQSRASMSSPKKWVLHLPGSELRLCRADCRTGQLVVVGCGGCWPRKPRSLGRDTDEEGRGIREPRRGQRHWLPFPSAVSGR